LEHCAVAKSTLVVLQHHPLHWQALLPLDSAGRVRPRPPPGGVLTAHA
jgi:hypothetical protein